MEFHAELGRKTLRFMYIGRKIFENLRKMQHRGKIMQLKLQFGRRGRHKIWNELR